jgi:hypothetical protein
MPPSAIVKLRKLCLALPEAHEQEAWGEPTFRARNKMFAMHVSANNHHWAELQELLHDGYRRLAPKKLLGLLDERQGP